MRSIIYTSNTGATKKYAELFAQTENMKAYDLNGEIPETTDDVVYFGWLRAGKIVGLKKAMKKFKVAAIVAVGINMTNTGVEAAYKANNIPKEIPVFTVQGGYEKDKLKGMNKFLMNIVEKVIIKKINEGEKTPESQDMLDLMTNGGTRFDEKNLDGIKNWIRK